MTLLAWLISLALGSGIVYHLWRPETRNWRQWLFLLTLGYGVGVAVGSCLLYLWLHVAGEPGRSFPALELVAAALLMATAFWRRGSEAGHGRALHGDGLPASRCILFLSVCLLAVSALYLALMASWSRHGAWDAMAIWNLRARFIYRGMEDWRLAFDPCMASSHNDYPLLIPLSVVRHWLYAGRENLASPLVNGLSFPLASLAVLVMGIQSRGPQRDGLLAGCLLLSTPFYLYMGAGQTADVPLAHFLLCAVMVLLLRESQEDASTRMKHGILAGIFLGCALWTKNEGLLIAGSVLFARVVALLLRKSIGAALRDVLPILAGCLPFLLVLIHFKMTLAPPGDLLTPEQAGHWLGRLMDPSRILLVADETFTAIFSFGDWIIAPVAALPLYALIKAKKDWHQNVSVISGFAAVTLILVGYSVIYLLTPHDLSWHLATSQKRLLLHLWPTTIALVMAM